MAASITSAKGAPAPPSILSAAMGLTSLRSPGATAANASGDEATSVGSGTDGVGNSTVLRDLFMARAGPHLEGADAIEIFPGAAPANANYEPLTSLRPGATAANSSGDKAASIGLATAGGGNSTVLRNLFMVRAEPHLEGADAIEVLPRAAPACTNYEPLSFNTDVIEPQPWPATGAWPPPPVLVTAPHPHSHGTSFPLAATCVTPGTPAGGLRPALPHPPPAAVIHPGTIYPGAMAENGTVHTPLLVPGLGSLPVPVTTAGVPCPPGPPPMGLVPAGMLPPGLALAAHHPGFPYMQTGPVGFSQPMVSSVPLPAPSLPGDTGGLVIVPHGSGDTITMQSQEMSAAMPLGHSTGPGEDDGGLSEVMMTPIQERKFAEYLFMKRTGEE